MIPAADQVNNTVTLWRWIGANDLVTAGTWQWEDGQAFWSGGSSGSALNGLYSNWSHGEPGGGASDCVVMASRPGDWHTLPCPDAHPYICEQY
jgi:hypothetical protein